MRAVVAAVDQFVDLFTQLGGLMAERVTDLRDIRDRVIAELSGLPEPGVPVPDVPSVLCAEDLAPADTAGLDPALVVALATTLGRPDQPHRDHRPPARASPAWSPSTDSTTVAAGAMVLVDGTRGTVTVAPDAADAAEAVAAAQRDADAGGGLDGPRRDRRRPRRRGPGQRPGRRGRPIARAKPRPRASACSAPNCASSTATPNPRVDEQAQIYGEVLEAFAGTQGRHPHAGRRIGQAAEVRRASRRGQPGARRARHPHRRGQPRAAGAAARRASPPRPSAPATRRG